jgi:hypothetical protein
VKMYVPRNASRYFRKDSSREAKRIRAAQCTLKTMLCMHILIRNIFDIT